jgi:hypothetical protein
MPPKTRKQTEKSHAFDATYRVQYIKLKKKDRVFHEVDTSFTEEDTHRVTWKKTWIDNLCARMWPAKCPLCTNDYLANNAVLGAHIHSAHFTGVGIIPCCSACNSNPSKDRGKSHELREDAWVLVVSAQEWARILCNQRRTKAPQAVVTDEKEDEEVKQTEVALEPLTPKGMHKRCQEITKKTKWQCTRRATYDGETHCRVHRLSK